MHMSNRRLISGIRQTIVYCVLLVACFVSIFPIAWAVSTSFKIPPDIARFPPEWIPDPITFEHYEQTVGSMSRYLINNLIVAIGSITVTLVIAVHAAYAAARADFPFKGMILFLILCTMMIPGIAVLIPLYIVASSLGLLNTYTVFILIFSAWQIPMALWLLKGFFETIPSELEEAAMIDGYGRLGAFYRVALPLVRPGLAAAAIVVFVFVWNEFIISLTMVTKDSYRLVTVGLYYYLTAYGIEWGKLMSAVVMALMPLLAAFLLLQKQFIRGLTAGAQKG